MLRKVSFPGEDRGGKRGSENIGSMLGKVTLARSVPLAANDPCLLPMHEGDPLIAFVGKRPCINNGVRAIMSVPSILHRSFCCQCTVQWSTPSRGSWKGTITVPEYLEIQNKVEEDPVESRQWDHGFASFWSRLRIPLSRTDHRSRS